MAQEERMTIPIACRLSEPEVRERERTVFAALRSQTCHVAECADGYVLELAPSDEALAAATALIQLERTCCPFLRFTLTVEPGEAGVRLALTGGPGVREFLGAWLGASAR
jgi:hypothetical protein